MNRGFVLFRAVGAVQLLVKQAGSLLVAGYIALMGARMLARKRVRDVSS